MSWLYDIHTAQRNNENACVDLLRLADGFDLVGLNDAAQIIRSAVQEIRIVSDQTNRAVDQHLDDGIKQARARRRRKKNAYLHS